MQFNHIDEIIKRGIEESEIRNEFQILQAKNKVWESIDKPNRKNQINWAFVSAIAASVLLFIISTILFLKTESQQKELEALQALKFAKSDTTIEGSPNSAIIPIIVTENDAIEEPENFTESREKENAFLVEKTTYENVIVQTEPIEPIALSKPFAAVFLPQIDLAGISMLEKPVAADLGREKKSDESLKLNNKHNRKLKFRIGNGTKSFDQHHMLALTIKL